MIRVEFKISKINIRFNRKISDAGASTSTAHTQSQYYSIHI